MAWVTAGELLGFGAPAVAGAVTAQAPAPTLVGAMLISGAVEGTVPGLAQAIVLRQAIPGVSTTKWTLATVIGAVLAWIVGLLPGVIWDQIQRLPWLVQAALAITGAVLLLSIGGAQWTVLRTHLPRARRWIAATAAAWLGGLPAFAAITTPPWQPGQSTPATAAVGVLGGAAMATVMAAITGSALVRLVDEGDRRQPNAWRAGPST